MESDAMAPIAISIASDDYDRVRALRSGRVGVEGCAVTYLTLPPSETFPRLFNHQEFDVSEMSLSTYMLARSKGPWPYRAIPVLLSRVFPHCSIWIRTDRGISGPEDLKGRAIGAPSYHFTRLLCVRGMLSDEYGVRPADIRWRLGGYNQPQRRNYVGAEPPQGVDVETIDADKSLNGMLESGELDAAIGARDPLAFLQRAPHIDRLFPDFRPLEQAYYRKTGIFPVMHVIGVRESLIEAHPWLAPQPHEGVRGIEGRVPTEPGRTRRADGDAALAGGGIRGHSFASWARTFGPTGLRPTGRRWRPRSAGRSSRACRAGAGTSRNCSSNRPTTGESGPPQAKRAGRGLSPRARLFESSATLPRHASHHYARMCSRNHSVGSSRPPPFARMLR